MSCVERCRSVTQKLTCTDSSRALSGVCWCWCQRWPGDGRSSGDETTPPGMFTCSNHRHRDVTTDKLIIGATASVLLDLRRHGDEGVGKWPTDGRCHGDVRGGGWREKENETFRRRQEAAMLLAQAAEGGAVVDLLQLQWRLSRRRLPDRQRVAARPRRRRERRGYDVIR